MKKDFLLSIIFLAGWGLFLAYALWRESKTIRARDIATNVITRAEARSREEWEKFIQEVYKD